MNAVSPKPRIRVRADGTFPDQPSMMALTGFSGRAYDAGRWDTPEMVNWTPPLTDSTDEVLDSRDAVTRRARDLVRNNPIISGAIDRRAESVVGANIRVESQPAFELIGQNADWADAWATNVENLFEVWGKDPRNLCDAQMHSQFGGLVDTAYRHWWVDGEAAATIKLIPATKSRIGAKFETAIDIIDPDRISNPNGAADYTVLQNGNTLIGGIEYDKNNAAVAYHIRKSHPSQMNGMTDVFTWVRVRRFGRTGKPLFVHAFKRNRADQKKGISRFVAAIKRIKMFDRYDDAELEAALLNSVMAASVTSNGTTQDVAEMLAPAGGEAESAAIARMSYRTEHPIRTDRIRTLHLLDSEKYELHRAEHPSQNYPDFQASGLRQFASNFGLSYAQVSQNWADINYSSARAMLNEIWRGLLHDRTLFTQAFCTPIYSAFLEEAVARGMVQIPGGPLNYYVWRSELTMCEWMGPGRGSVDPLKEGQANEFEYNMGVADLDSIGAQYGRDPRKTLRKQARDRKFRESLGLPEYQPLKTGGPQGDEAQPTKAEMEDAE